MRSTTAVNVVVAGFGSTYRHDDAVGSVVAERAVARMPLSHYVGPLADPLDLLGVWNEADLVIVVDAVTSGAPVGTLHTLEIDVNHDVPERVATTSSPGVASTHGIGLTAVLGLARALHQAPRRLVVVAIEGERFDLGEGLSAAVEAAVPLAVQQVVELIEEVQPCA
ncbi:MAG: hydrogenase maturation protease [Acidimicrobiales bacterium]|jgi:hydrogenase maturation protease